MHKVNRMKCYIDIYIKVSTDFIINNKLFKISYKKIIYRFNTYYFQRPFIVLITIIL